ncbi:MAG TPA: cobalamin-independent methionine synthase II family protein [Methylomirabilota bacterium]|nr:cobalamin-independent methionine synthase II family protein [Methylomirabilota bacterium]
MATIHRADTIGSLLRPSYLVEARQALEKGLIDAAEFKRIEDRAVDGAIALQEGVGLDVVSDGELRRFSFFDHLLAQIDGVAPIPGVGVTFHGERPGQEWDFQSPVTVVDKIRRKRMMTVEEYSYARAVARRPVKALLPSPVLLYCTWSPERSRGAYADAYELFADGARIVREEAQELARLGCTYIQIDSPDLGTLVDPENRGLRESMGMPTERTLTEGVDLINSVADVPGVTFGLHLCKGNYQGKWIATGGYELLAERVFRRATNFDVFLLEYDDRRSGSFEPLAKMPDDKVVVLGLISSKRPELEPVDVLVKRIDEAARYVGKDRLAISTQCGFSPVVIGANPVDERAQEAKLRLVADVADKVWG